MPIRRSRRVSNRRIPAKTIVRAVKTYNKRRKTAFQKRKAVSVFNKVKGMIPFTYRFAESSPHHHKHHHNHHPDSGTACVDLTTVLVPKAELAYCRKMARMVLMNNLKGRRVPKDKYFEAFRNLISQLLVEKCYQKYIMAENHEKLLEGGILHPSEHHHKHGETGAEADMEHAEHEEEARLNRRFENAFVGALEGSAM